MLDNATIDNLTKEARPVDFRTLRSYIRWAPSVAYVRRDDGALVAKARPGNLEVRS